MYNMKLNYNTCVHGHQKCRAQVKFADGSPMKRLETAEYLGGNLIDRADHCAGIATRIEKYTCCGVALVASRNGKFKCFKL